MHMHIPACIAVGVVFRVVVVARVVAQPAADARSRHTHSISCAHNSHVHTPIWSEKLGLESGIKDLGSGIRSLGSEKSVIRGVGSGVLGSGIRDLVGDLVGGLESGGLGSGVGGLELGNIVTALTHYINESEN